MTKTVTTGKATDLITFTRSTTGTYLDSVKYGDELVTNGTFDSDSDWIKDSGWTISNGQAQCDGTDGAQFRTIDSPLTDGKTYYISYEITAYTSGDIQVLGQGFYGISGNSVSTVTGIFVATKPYVRFYSSAFNGSIDNVSVKEIIGNQGTSGEPLLRTANTNEPRIEYDADGNLKGLLIEEQRTNKVLYSNRLSGSAWSGTNCLITTDFTTSPDGSINASKVTCSGGSASVWQYPIPSGLSGNYSNSIYLKADTLNYAQLNVGYLTTDFVANFDLVNGTVTHILGTGATITNVGNGWFRCTLPFNTLGLGGFSVTPIDSMSSTRRSGAVGSVFVYGAQLESGTFPTSYIPTSGSTVTRNADVATINVSEFEYSQNEGTVVVDFIPTDHPSSTYNQLIVSDGGSKRWVYFNDTATYSVAGFDGTNQIAITGVLAPIKAAIGLSSTQGSIAANGDASANSTDVAHNGNILTSTSFDIAANTTTHIKSVQYYPLRLTNNQLKALTQ